MFTKDFSAFENMVYVTKNEKLKYRIFYSQCQKVENEERFWKYSILLTTELYNLVYTTDWSNKVESFMLNLIHDNGGVELGSWIDAKPGAIELKGN